MSSLILTNISVWIDTFVIFFQSELAPQREYPIVLNSCNNLPNKFIIYNTEQLTRANCLNHIIELSKNNSCMEIWDYSIANIEILLKHNIRARHVPPKMPEPYLLKLQSFRTVGQTYDVGFNGSISKKRIDILNSISERGFKVYLINGVFGEERDKELAKCKILLNIHYANDYQVFESARCEPWLAIGVPVISENSLDNDPRCINVSYNDIVNKTIEVLRSL